MEKVTKRITFIVGFPECKWFGHNGDYNVLAMTTLGPNLM